MNDKEEELEANSEGLELNDFLNSHKLPCYVNLKNNEGVDESLSIQPEQLYFYKTFESDCLFAKCYSNLFENYVLNRRPSYAPSESNLNTATKHSELKYMFNDVVSIPIEFEGLFEIFSSNSIKHDGILDHEKDIIGLASRLTMPRNYFVAKEMKVYEISKFQTV